MVQNCPVLVDGHSSPSALTDKLRDERQVGENAVPVGKAGRIRDGS